MPPRISAIIVNYATGQHVINCIADLQCQLDVELQIIVVDNNSPDDSVALIQSKFANKIQLVINQQNVGFSNANNIGFKHATGDYIVCINPDIRIQNTYLLLRLVEALSADKNIGMIAPKILEDRKARVIKPKTSYPYQSKTRYTPELAMLPGKYAWLLGAFIMLPFSVFARINGFDQDYFLYGEDADLGLRVRRAGFEIEYCADLNVQHWSSSSEVTSNSYDKWFRKKSGLYLFFKKNYHAKDVARILRYRFLVCNVALKWQQIKLIFGICNQEKQAKLKAELDVLHAFKQA